MNSNFKGDSFLWWSQAILWNPTNNQEGLLSIPPYLPPLPKVYHILGSRLKFRNSLIQAYSTLYGHPLNIRGVKYCMILTQFLTSHIVLALFCSLCTWNLKETCNAPIIAECLYQTWPTSFHFICWKRDERNPHFSYGPFSKPHPLLNENVAMALAGMLNLLSWLTACDWLRRVDKSNLQCHGGSHQVAMRC